MISETSVTQDRRTAGDRRRASSFPPRFSAHRRRRSAGRRGGDCPGYVDIYDVGTWAVALSILALSFIDAFSTTLLISSANAREANPLMEAVLDFGGAYTFVSVKILLTSFPLVIIVMHQEWRLARFAARTVLLAYVLLAIYHVFLLAMTF